MGLTTGELKPLFEILRDDSNPTSPRLLTPEGSECLKLIKQQLAEAHLNYIDYRQPLLLLVFCTALQSTAVFCQEGPILWVHGRASPKKVVQPYLLVVLEVLHTAYLKSLRTFGKSTDKAIVPYIRNSLTDSSYLAWNRPSF